MSDLVVVVPSRGRPTAAGELALAFARTCTANTALVFAVAADDPTLPDYRRTAALDLSVDVEVYTVKPVDRPSTMVHNLNEAAVDVAGRHGVTAVGFMGDDHRPRTHGWDEAYLAVLADLGTGIAYGDDLLQGRELPTQCAITSDIVRALGWMAPPKLWHMFSDDFWRDLGRAADCLAYVPHVVVEHLHPLAGKADWDTSYRVSNSPAVYRHDAAVYGRFLAAGMPAAVETVRALRERWADDRIGVHVG